LSPIANDYSHFCYLAHPGEATETPESLADILEKISEKWTMNETLQLICFFWITGTFFTWGFGLVDEDKYAEEIMPTHDSEEEKFATIRKKIARSKMVTFFVACLLLWPVILGEALRKSIDGK
jgi:hypothetical protein